MKTFQEESTGGGLELRRKPVLGEGKGKEDQFSKHSTASFHQRRGPEKVVYRGGHFTVENDCGGTGTGEKGNLTSRKDKVKLEKRKSVEIV